MREQEVILLANVFQGFYFFSVLLMWAACYDKVRGKGFHCLSLKDKGTFVSASVAVITFLCVQFGDMFGLLDSSKYMTAPMSFFVWSVYYNLEEYAGVNIFNIFNEVK